MTSKGHIFKVSSAMIKVGCLGLTMGPGTLQALAWVLTEVSDRV
jgi:hypothetical protein